LGSIEAGKDYDPTELVRSFKDPKNRPILYDQGSDDWFVHHDKQLHIPDFMQAAHEGGVKIDFKFREGY